jgi:hypothetical protein
VALGRGIEEQRFVLEILRRQESLRREPMRRLHHRHELIVEQRMHEQAPVFDAVIRDADVDGAVEEQFVDLTAGARDNLHVNAGTGGSKAAQHLRQPVVLRVAAGRNAEAPGLAARETANRILGAFEHVEDLVG